MPVNAAAKVFKSPGVKILACFHAQNGIGPFWPEGYARQRKLPGFQQGEALARLAAANAGQERAGAIHGPDCPALIHAAFKTVGCFPEIRPNLREVLRIVAGAKTADS